jgi:hypothetical protein
MKKVFAALLLLVLFAPARSNAAEDWGWRVGRTIVDLAIARPFTFAATVIGGAVWTATLPITLPTHTSREALDTMVISPWNYTIDRPLGEFEED